MDGNCSSSTSSVKIPKRETSATFYFSDPVPESVTITATAGVGSDQLTITVTGGGGSSSPDHLVLNGPASVLVEDCSAAFTVTQKDASGNDATSDVETVFLMETSSSGQFFADADCSSGVGQLGIPAGASLANFFYSDSTPGEVLLTVEDSSGVLAGDSVSVAIVEPSEGPLTAFWTFEGVTDERLGSPKRQGISEIGDMNGDGYADFIVGANTHRTEGRAYVFTGGPAGPSLLYEYSGAFRGASFGRAVSGVGDFNSDGYPDFAVGSRAPGRGNKNHGQIYVYSGLDGSLLYNNVQETNDGFGMSIADLGDVDGDGIDDLAVGHFETSGPGKLTVILGQTGQIYYTLVGEQDGSKFGGVAVDGIGDIDGDGLGDIVVGANRFDSDRGKVYVYSGFDGTLINSISGEKQGDRLGKDVHNMGDVNGDGINDFAAGAFLYNLNGNDELGKVYVYSGFDGSTLFSQVGEEPGGSYAAWLGSAGDITGDGVSELAVGSNQNDDFRGKVYVYDVTTSQLVYTAEGESSGDEFGKQVAGVGDVDGDGKLDLLVAAPEWGSAAGKIYLFSF
jgi:hypothetical protein